MVHRNNVTWLRTPGAACGTAGDGEAVRSDISGGIIGTRRRDAPGREKLSAARPLALPLPSYYPEKEPASPGFRNRSFSMNSLLALIVRLFRKPAYAYVRVRSGRYTR